MKTKHALLILIAALAAPPALAAEGPFVFHALPPCRVLDTRLANGPTGGAPLTTDTTYKFFIQTRCGVPQGATAISANYTITQPTNDGHLITCPSSQDPVGFSTMNWTVNLTIANGAIVPLAAYNSQVGDLAVRPFVAPGPVNRTTHLIIDVNGYFANPAP